MVRLFSGDNQLIIINIIIIIIIIIPVEFFQNLTYTSDKKPIKTVDFNSFSILFSHTIK